jgi:2'-5' RNA ligase
MQRDTTNTKLFFVAIVPPEPLRTSAQKIKEDFAAEYGTSAGLKSPPHITLVAPFKADAKTETEIIRFLTDFAQKSSGFTLSIDGFDCFNVKVIFLKPTSNRLMAALGRKLNSEFYKRFPFRRPAGISFHPHMTIAYRDLSLEVFQRSWEQYKDRPFAAQCAIDRLFMLRHNGDRWVEYREFMLGQLYLPI